MSGANRGGDAEANAAAPSSAAAYAHSPAADGPAEAFDNAAIVRRAEAAMLAALPRRLGAEVLAVSLGVTPQALRHAFQVMRGDSVYNALRVVRLREACAALGAGAISPEMIAHRFGFGSMSMLKLVHRRIHGVALGAAAEGDGEAGA